MMDARHPLTRHTLFHGLPDGEIAAIRALLRQCRFQRGDVLFHEGDEPGDVLFIMSGAVKIFVGAGPTERVLAYVLPGESVGEMAAIDGLRRSATGLAIEDTEAYCVGAEEFIRFVERAPILSLRLLRLTSARLRRMDEHAADLLFLERRPALG